MANDDSENGAEEAPQRAIPVVKPAQAVAIAVPVARSTDKGLPAASANASAPSASVVAVAPVVDGAVESTPAIPVATAVAVPQAVEPATPKPVNGAQEGAGWVSKAVLGAVVLGCAIGFATMGGVEEAPPPPKTLLPDRPYVLYVSEIEAQSVMPGDLGWDVGDDSAPDLFYEVWWRGNKVYESDTRLDGLIANWIPVGVNVKESLLNGTVSMDQTIRVPLVSYSAAGGGASVTIRVYDYDPFPLSNDEVGQFQVSLSSLLVGDNALHFNGEHGIRRIRLRTVDNTLPLAEKVAELMKP